MISINKIKSGSEASFAQVFKEFDAKLYYYFYKKAGSKETARELVQLTFIKLWQFRHTLTDDVPLEVQLFHMATSVFIDYFRKQNTINGKVRHLDELVSGELYETDLGTHAKFENEDYLTHLTASLPPVRKKVFLYSRVQGYSYKEIATTLSISVKTVEDHMTKALKHIRSASFLFIFLAFLIDHLH